MEDPSKLIAIFVNRAVESRLLILRRSGMQEVEKPHIKKNSKRTAKHLMPKLRPSSGIAVIRPEIMSHSSKVRS
jgi:hypothetical protein